MGASAAGIELGLPTLLAGLATLAAVLLVSGRGAMRALGRISWGVLPLVAGLFVLVEALERTGVTRHLATLLHDLAARSNDAALWASGPPARIRLQPGKQPSGRITGRQRGAQAGVAPHVRAAVLIGVDPGPNLSITGSLATLLWLVAARRP